MRYFQTLIPSVLFAPYSFANLSSHSSAPSSPPFHVLTRVVTQFPKPTWLENIATLRNGSLITSIFASSAEVHLVDSSTNLASLLYNFTVHGYNSVAGIAEIEDDVWAVTTENYSPTAGPALGSSSIWKIDLSSADVKVDKIIDLKDAQLANGLTVVNPTTILYADSFAGNIGRVTLFPNSSAKSDVALIGPSLAANFTAPTPIGVNGLKYSAPYLYWTNTWQGRVVRAPIDAITGSRTGDDEILAEGLSNFDDLVLSPDGKTAYAMRPYAKTIEKIPLPAKNGVKPEAPSVLLGGPGSTVVPGATAATFGRGKSDQGVMYVSTQGGALGDNGDGGVIEGGKIVAVYMDKNDICW